MSFGDRDFFTGAPSVDPQSLLAHLHDRYGDLELDRVMPAERDFNLKLRTASGHALAKVINTRESQALVEAQALALEHIAMTAPDLSVPHPILGLDGATYSTKTIDGRGFAVQMLSCLVGEIIWALKLTANQLGSGPIDLRVSA